MKALPSPLGKLIDGSPRSEWGLKKITWENKNGAF